VNDSHAITPLSDYYDISKIPQDMQEDFTESFRYFCERPIRCTENSPMVLISPAFKHVPGSTWAYYTVDGDTLRLTELDLDDRPSDAWPHNGNPSTPWNKTWEHADDEHVHALVYPVDEFGPRLHVLQADGPRISWFMMMHEMYPEAVLFNSDKAQSEQDKDEQNVPVSVTPNGDNVLFPNGLADIIGSMKDAIQSSLKLATPSDQTFVGYGPVSDIIREYVPTAGNRANSDHEDMNPDREDDEHLVFTALQYWILQEATEVAFAENQCNVLDSVIRLLNVITGIMSYYSDNDIDLAKREIEINNLRRLRDTDPIHGFLYELLKHERFRNFELINSMSKKGASTQRISKSLNSISKYNL